MSKKLVPFGEFVDSLKQASVSEFSQDPSTNVKEVKNFDEMKSHLIAQYDGMTVPHSFMDEDGQIWDCVPIDQQPSLRGKGNAATPPDMPVPIKSAKSTTKKKAIELTAQLSADRKDHLGNAMYCPDGTIPIRRITLEELSRFETLDHYFQKSPFGKGGHPRHGGAKMQGDVSASGVPATHKYAHAYQIVKNLGGHSFLNVWQPGIGANQIFSLSQHWYAGGSGNKLQTVECGWQVYPQMYGNNKPCLFIYWTADGYNQTGNYNLTKPAFVQTNKAWTLGGALSPVSTYNGAQFELEFTWYLFKGNWWLYLKGTTANEAIGYYPTSLFAGGQLATCALDIDYGGETVGTTSWPAMGSGHLPSEGFGKAAYQRRIYYFPVAGGATNASLTTSQPSPSCYKINFFASGGSAWNPYFFFGGPGGSGC